MSWEKSALLVINFRGGAVIRSEHSYRSIDDLTGFIKPIPPRQQGNAKTSRSVSDTVLRPVIEEINWYRMASSKGVRSSEMFGIVLRL